MSFFAVFRRRRKKRDKNIRIEKSYVTFISFSLTKFRCGNLFIAFKCLYLFYFPILCLTFCLNVVALFF